LQLGGGRERRQKNGEEQQSGDAGRRHLARRREKIFQHDDVGLAQENLFGQHARTWRAALWSPNMPTMAFWKSISSGAVLAGSKGGIGNSFIDTPAITA
jgi:hypothetical protein